MGPFTALLFAAAGLAAEPVPARGIQVLARTTATATIIRAEQASADPGPEGVQRRVRRMAGGGRLIEFD